MIWEDFLGPAEENFKEWDHTTRLGEFKDKYKDSITEELCNKCKEAEGDESFDLADKVFSDYDAMEGDKMPEEEYVASVVASLTEQLNALKETLNAEEVVVETKEDGEVEVKADDEVVAESKEVEVDNTGDADLPADETPAEDEHSVEEAEEDEHQKELDDFIKELESEKDNKKNSNWW